MSTFAYRARDDRGALITGQLEGNGLDEIQSQLSSRGLSTLSITKVAEGLNFPFLKKIFEPKVSGDEVLVTTRQFYTLFKAGMSMEAVLATLVRQTSNKTLKKALKKIHVDVSSGSGLSAAFSKHQNVFGELYTSMMAAGEEAGILEEVLENLCKLLEKEMHINSSVKSATLYPKIVIFVLGIATVVIMTFVVPKFASFFSHYKAELPLPTRILMGFSTFIQNDWYMVAGVAVAGMFLFKKYAATARGKLKVGALRFKLPVFGPLNIKVANARFCHILSALYKSGLPIHRSLEITGGTIGNGAFMREVEILKSEVTRGRMISEGMASCHYFTPVIVDATAVGEKTGALDEMLESMGNHYDLEVEHTIKNLTTLLEPILLGFIFGMVTIFTLAIFLPIWNMSQVVSGHH